MSVLYTPAPRLFADLAIAHGDVCCVRYAVGTTAICALPSSLRGLCTAEIPRGRVRTLVAAARNGFGGVSGGDRKKLSARARSEALIGIISV